MFGSALPPITMHEYEHWQIAPTRDPSKELFQFQDFNNDRLRLVSITIMFLGVALSGFATIYGYIGSSCILPLVALLGISTTMKGTVKLANEVDLRYLWLLPSLFQLGFSST